MWISFFFLVRCSSELLPVLQPETQHCPCTLFRWNESLRNTSKKEWIDSTFVTWIMQRRNHWKSALLWRVCPCGVSTEGSVLLHHKERPWTLPPSYLPQIIEKENLSSLVPCSSLFLTRGSLGGWGGRGAGWPVNFNSEILALLNQPETVTVTFYLFCSDLMFEEFASPPAAPSFLWKEFSTQITPGRSRQQHLFKTPCLQIILFL